MSAGPINSCVTLQTNISTQQSATLPRFAINFAIWEARPTRYQFCYLGSKAYTKKGWNMNRDAIVGSQQAVIAYPNVLIVWMKMKENCYINFSFEW